MEWQGSWIWTNTQLPSRNAFVRFRRSFNWNGGAANLHITADSRYVLYINGVYLGQGPVRAWPAHWKYDTYNIMPYLQPGDNVIAVLVNHYGEGNFQYEPGPAGLLAQLEGEAGCILATDTQWLVSPDHTFTSVTPRISVQQAFVEHYDARQDDGWTFAAYKPVGWKSAVVAAQPGDPPHLGLEPRDIPQLTLEPIQPVRVVSVEAVKSRYHRWHLYLKPYLQPQDISSNKMVHHAYVYTQVWSPTDAAIRVVRPNQAKVNGQPVERDHSVQLHAGWNEIMASFCSTTHQQATTIVLDGAESLRFAARGPAGGSAWAVLGPFALTEKLQNQLYHNMDDSAIGCGAQNSTATAELGEAIWAKGSLVDDLQAMSLLQDIQPEHLPEDIFLQSYYDQAVPAAPRVDNQAALLSGNHEWAVVHPCAEGDVRILLDFGKEVVGFHRFEVEGADGTMLDWHNFEFIQPDGRYNLAEGMNNVFRYTMRAGQQTYQTYVRRGFQYSYVTIRNQKAPVRIRLVEVLFNTYPQLHQGSFASANAQLDRIWQVGAHSLRCCAEDTYVDCPSYEQTNWVGDARNEALVDWVINGDRQLWYRCLEQTGESLDRSPLTESNVPSAWRNILPAWSFLWMRSCREYFLFTGDKQRAEKLLDFVRRNVVGIRQHLNAQGLFEIRGWNMFDWAAMDTPTRGVVTHQNCFAVLALKECAEMATWLNAPGDAAEWCKLADSIAEAVNTYLWNTDRQAYTDCLHGNAHSEVFSQQTQTVAYMAGVACGERAELCRKHMHNPPEGFVRAGSPFFEFFLLEGLANEGRDTEFLNTILRDWGFMVDKGASTFWEMWSRILPGGRLTRSHCHGWSAAPTFFLSTHVLGVKPLSPGFARFSVAPKPGGLAWCRGTVPTPHGIIQVQWENKPEQPFFLQINAPQGLEAVITVPSPQARVVLNGVEQKSTN